MKTKFPLLLFILFLVNLLKISAQARVQVIHNSADLTVETVDVYLNDELLIDDFQFRTSTPFIDAPAGETLVIKIAPSDSTCATDAIYSQSLGVLVDGETYIVVADGILSTSGYAALQPFSLEVYDQGREAALNTTSNTDVLVHHGATDAPTIDIITSGGTLLVDDVSYTDFTNYLELPTSNYLVKVATADGSIEINEFGLLLETFGFLGDAITVVANGFLDPAANSNGPEFGLWASTPNGGPLVELIEVPNSSDVANIQFIHNSADLTAEKIDIKINGNLVLNDFEFRTASPFIEVPVNATIRINRADGTNFFVAPNLTFDNGETYVIVINGISPSIGPSGYNPPFAFSIDTYAMARTNSLTAGNTDVLVNHGSTDAPSVDINEVSAPSILVDDMSYKDFSGYLQLPNQDYTINVTSANGATVVQEYRLPLRTYGLKDAAVTVVASGFLDPTVNNDGSPFGLWLAKPEGGALIELPLADSIARVQVIHNSADLAAETVDVYLNDELLLDDFEFRTASPFMDATAGTDLEVKIAPSSSTSSADAIYTQALGQLTAGETYILVADGIVSSTGYMPATSFGLEVYALGREASSTAGNTDVLVHHGSTDAPTVDINEVTGPSILVDDASYLDFAGYLELPTNNYQINVSTADGSTVVEQYSAPLTTLGLENAAVTIVASGFLDPSVNSNGPAFGLWVALPEGGDLIELFSGPKARVQVIHNSADLAAQTVDVYLNDELLLDDFEFRTASPFIDAPAGPALEVKIAPSSSTSSADAIFTQSLGALVQGETYVVVADGIVSSSGYSPTQAFGLEIYGLGREASSTAGNTDVLVHHGSTDAPTVDINEVNGPAILVDNASYTDFAGYLELPTADYTINVSTSDGITVVEEYSAPLATLGLTDEAITVVASGFLDPSVNSNGPSFGLWVALASGGALVELPTTPEPTARVQVIHNSADLAAETVDVYLNNALLIDDFQFRTASPFIDAPAGPVLEIQIAPSDSTCHTDAIFTQSLGSLLEDETYIVVADGIISSTGYNPAPAFGLEVYALGRETSSTAGNTDILVHHGSTDAPTVDVNEVTGPAILVDNASYTDFAGYLELPTADYTINVSTADGSTVVQEYSAPLLTGLAGLSLENEAITVVASGFLDPATNSAGPEFGLWVALASGGDLIPLPTSGVLSNEEFELQGVNIYPNPASERININTLEILNTSVNIFDMLGRKVKSTQLFNAKNILDISNLKTGLYIVQLSNDNGSKTVKIRVN